MILEVREVGRKTPGDGRLEVTEASFRRLTLEASRLVARVGDHTSPASLDRMPCTCAKGEGGAHEHRFVRAEVFRTLVAGESCVLDLLADGVLEVARPHPLEPGSGSDAVA